MSDGPNGTLSRWSQRKLAARRGAVIDEPPREKQAVAPVDVTAPATAGEQDSVAKVTGPETEIPELPPVDELTFQSDYTGFLNKNVPEALRRAALRKLWNSDPLFGFIDGLDDYCEDFNVIDTPITLAQTSYKVGKGYLDEVKEAVAELEGDNANKVEPASSGETSSAPAGPDTESPVDAPADEERVADGPTDESRQLAAAAPEAGEVPDGSGKT